MLDNKDVKDPRHNYILVNDLPGQNSDVAGLVHESEKTLVNKNIRNLAEQSIAPPEMLNKFIPQLKDYLRYWMQQKGIYNIDQLLATRVFVLPGELVKRNGQHETTGSANAEANSVTLYHQKTGFEEDEKNGSLCRSN